MNTEKKRPISIFNILAAIVMLGGLAVIGLKYASMLHFTLDDLTSKGSTALFWLLVAALPLPLVLFLNVKFPADKKQQVFSDGLVQDFAYVFLRLAVRVSLIVMLWEILGVIHLKYFAFLRVDLPIELPSVIRVFIAFVFIDLLFYFDHRIRHQVPIFWHFHAVHHSQRELNYFSDSRSHIFDRVWSLFLVAIPSLVINLNAPQVLMISLMIEFHQAIYHTNLRTNYGWLRYILVTPQSHRIHHSILNEHQNKNFGGSLSIWDSIFGTSYRGCDEYPQTGVADADFPVENGKNPIAIMDTMGAQFWYPLKLVLRDIRAMAGYSKFSPTNQMSSRPIKKERL
jgi:sterol desaturase/sphingolipid hydroxylase (fatty acid hydroxylase superfamily)